MVTHTGVRTWPSDVRQIAQLILTNFKERQRPMSNVGIQARARDTA